MIVPPEPPTLVIAYSDVNNNGVYDTGDVMISKIVDTDGSGTISPTDTIKMGVYPTSPFVVAPARVREAFEPWRVPTHTVATFIPGADYVYVTTATGTHSWSRTAGTETDQYYEDNGAGTSYIVDKPTAGDDDAVFTNPASPSQPTSGFNHLGKGMGDDSFLDVIIYTY